MPVDLLVAPLTLASTTHSHNREGRISQKEVKMEIMEQSCGKTLVIPFLSTLQS